MGLSPKEKSAQALRCGAKFPCSGSYVQDFRILCPEEWSEDLDHACVAPGSYRGPCVGRKSFVEFASKEKVSWGEQCGVKWPLRLPGKDTSLEAEKRSVVQGGSPCLVDFSSPCPDYWATNLNVCIAPPNYQGPCSLRVDSSKWSFDEKMAFSGRCLAPWP